MEQLLFLLFVLFSVVSALLERRKRRRQLEEQKQHRTERLKRQEQEPEPPYRSQVEVSEEEEERVAGGPFVGDPFDLEPPRPGQPESQAERAERSALEREREALAAERRALEVERMALESVRQTEGGALRQRVSDLLRQRAVREQAVQAAPATPVRVGKWTLDPARARDAIVYAEILGRPRAERPDIQ